MRACYLVFFSPLLLFCADAFSMNLDDADALFNDIAVSQDDYQCYKDENLKACVDEYGKHQYGSGFARKAHDKVYEILLERKDTRELEFVLSKNIITDSKKKQRLDNILYKNYKEMASSGRNTRVLVKAYQLKPSRELATRFAERASISDLVWAADKRILGDASLQKVIVRRAKEDGAFAMDLFESFETLARKPKKAGAKDASVALQKAYRVYARNSDGSRKYMLKAYDLSGSEQDLKEIIATNSSQDSYQLSQNQLAGNQSFKDFLIDDLKTKGEPSSLYFLAKLTGDSSYINKAISYELKGQNAARLDDLFSLYSEELRSVEDIPTFFGFLRQCQKCKKNEFLHTAQRLPGFGDSFSDGKLYNSVEYRYVLTYIDPVVEIFSDGDSYGVNLDYGEYTFNRKESGDCDFKRSRTVTRSLGFFEGVFNAIGNENYQGKRIDYNIYSCRTTEESRSNILKFLDRVGVNPSESFRYGLLEHSWENEMRVGSSYIKGTASDRYASDMKNMCLGARSGSLSQMCYNIKSSDLKNACLGMSNHSGMCYNVENRDMKNLCLAGSGEFPDFCYNIKNNDMKNACLGVTRDSSHCYGVRNSNLKLMCLGISNAKSNCYSIE